MTNANARATWNRPKLKAIEGANNDSRAPCVAKTASVSSLGTRMTGDAAPEISHASENCLKHLLRLQRQRIEHDHLVAPGELAQVLGITSPSVTAMLQRLGRDGLVDYTPYKGARLTERGRVMAARALRRHRLVETFLARILEYDWTEIDEEAERLESAISVRLLDRIDALLGFPAVDPHGDPIPDAAGNFRQPPGSPLHTITVGKHVCITRVLDIDQGFLQFLDEHGLRPGACLVVSRVHANAGTVTLSPDEVPGEPVTISLAAAEKLLVVPRSEKT